MSSVYDSLSPYTGIISLSQGEGFTRNLCVKCMIQNDGRGSDAGGVDKYSDVKELLRGIPSL